MKIGEIIKGFEIISRRESAELGGTLWELKHLKTGAPLLWMDNGEENKLFSIAFKTVPEDDTGVFHILEHSVLNGSEKYTVREPFVNLLKGSLNTFLNAMTYPDKTVYPVSSRNDKDFLNLSSVYLDAVFSPAIYNNPFIFMQEGWHFELPSGEDIPQYNGVVYNEMKGAYSSPDTLLNAGVMSLLYPDTIYKYESGGHPKAIPTLSYEQFINAHRENYHPSNSYVYLDGDLPLSEILDKLDSYFSRYEKLDIPDKIPVQKARPFIEDKQFYEGKSTDGSMLIFGKIFASFYEKEKVIAMSLLCDYLCGTNESPLKKAIINSGISPEVNMYTIDELKQPSVYLQLRQVDLSRKEELAELIKREISSLIEKGLDKNRLLAMIDQVEFAYRDMNEPRGLIRNISALSVWNYGGDPLSAMVCGDALEELRRGAEKEYFESILAELDLFGENAASLSLSPSESKAEEDAEELKAELSKIGDSWDEAQRASLRKTNEELAEWQALEDTPEALATIPTLKKEELPKAPPITPTEKEIIEGCPILWHELGTNGISHYNLYFPLADCSPEDLRNLSLLTNLLGEISTYHKSPAELDYEQKRLLGFIDYNLRYFDSIENRLACRPYFVVTFSTLEKNQKQAIELIREILCETDYDNKEFASLLSVILRQCKESLYQSILESGNKFAFMRAAAHMFAKDALLDLTEGISLYSHLCDFIDNFDKLIEDFKESVKGLVKRIFTSSRLTLSLAGRKDYEAVEFLIKKFSLGKKRLDSDLMQYEVDGAYEKEFIIIPSAVSYAAACCASDAENTLTDGSLAVLDNILRFDYLWNEIRVKGGAYGCGFVTRRNGALGFATYRDPSPLNSVEVFSKMPHFLKEFCRGRDNLDSYLIGAISACEPLLHIRSRAISADNNYFSGVCEEDRKQFRQKLLATDEAALLKYADLLQGKEEEFSLCIVGNKEAAPKSEDWRVHRLTGVEPLTPDK